MRLNEYVWVFPLVGGILMVIALLTPAASKYSIQIWMWGLIWTGGSLDFNLDVILLCNSLVCSLLIMFKIKSLIKTAIQVRKGEIRGEDSKSSWRNKIIWVIGITIIWMVIRQIYCSLYYSYNLRYMIITRPISSCIYFWGAYRPGFGVIGMFIGACITIPGIVIPSEPSDIKPKGESKFKKKIAEKKEKIKSKIAERRSSTANIEEEPIKKVETIKGIKPKKKQKESPEAETVQELTRLEKIELDKTESEVSVEEKEFMCIVHKGTIDGDIYLCPNCKTLYCERCAKTLKEKGENCWSCGQEIKTTITSEIQQEIQKLDSRIDSLKKTVKNLDETFYAGDIEKEEYQKMRNSLTEKITTLVSQINQLKNQG